MFHVKFTVIGDTLFYDGMAQKVHKHKTGFFVKVDCAVEESIYLYRDYYIEANNRHAFFHLPVELTKNGFIITKELLPREVFNFVAYYLKGTLK